MARCPSDASGLSVIEILLTVQGVLPVCGMLSFFFFFSRMRSCSQLPAVMGNSLLFLILLFIFGGTCSFVCVCGWVHACVSQRSTHAGFSVNVRVIVSSV